MTLILILTLIVLCIALFLLNKLNMAVSAFDSLILKFIESNQTFYEFQKLAKTKDLELNTAIAKSNMELRGYVRELEKNVKALSDKLRQLSDTVMSLNKEKIIKPDMSEITRLLQMRKETKNKKIPEEKNG